MADKDQLVDEQSMEKTSVAPPDPETGALTSHGGTGSAEGESLMDRLREHPSDQEVDRDTALQETSGDQASGVADEDPLSAHPS